MPGIAVLNPSPAFRFESSFPSKTTMQNGYQSNDESVAELKDRAKEKAFTAAKGFSATTLMRVALDKSGEAHKAEDAGDLRTAFEALTHSSCLIHTLMNGSEYKSEAVPGKKGAVYKDVNDWIHTHAKGIIARTTAVESKLKDLENSGITPAPSTTNGPGSMTIASRIASLQNAGLSLTPVPPTNKRFHGAPSHNSLSYASPPNRLKVQTSLPQPPTSPPMISVPTPHALVPTSSFGPPSPSSSTSSSPQLSQFGLSSVTEFAQQFPTIDELEEMAGSKSPSVISRNGSGSPSTSSRRPDPPSPITIPRSFPALPFDLSQRPSSTPIPSSIDTLISRPTSPIKSPLSPTFPRKQSNLALNTAQMASLISSASTPTPSSPPRPDKAELPKLPKSTMTTPKDLHEYIHLIGYKVLLLDVRFRDEFDKEHIKSDAVVCLEPIVLIREGITGEMIEDSLHVAPRGEQTLFTNRDKFDVVVICDESTTTYETNSPVWFLFRAIYELAFKKILKHSPMLLVGGLQAWKEHFGDVEVVRGISPGTSVDKESSLPRVTAPVYTRSTSGAGSNITVNGSYSSYPNEDQPRQSIDLIPGSSRLPDPDDASVSTHDANATKLVRRPAILQPPSLPPQPRTDSPFMSNGSQSIQYPAYPRNSTTIPSTIPTSMTSSPRIHDLVSLPPTASINPYPLSRRRSDYPDQSQDAMSGFNARPIDYPDLSSAHVLRPPPAAASPVLERQDNRPRLSQRSPSFSTSLAAPKPPTIPSDYPVTYWSDAQIGISGLKNLGNTCYMNATIQCLSATVPFARFFTDGRWKSAVNMMNPLGTKGNVAHAFASILHEMWQAEMPYLTPLGFRRSICTHASQFSGSDQHDSQEFLSFLLDGLHEDLNRILNKPSVHITPEREAELERLPPQIASDQEWESYRSRNDSLIVDFFQGQFRNRLECLTCHKTSTTYNAFMYLSLPIPTFGRNSTVSLQACLDALVNKEVMEKSDAWNCPNCKTLRKATKQLSLSRLPPILLIHLKRFSFKGPFTDKIESFVDFPMKGLDLTAYMPTMDSKMRGPSPADDPRAQVPPFTYDLYAVTNHFGSLSSGHYTSFVSSRGGWMYCDDSRVTPVDSQQVAGKPAYILFYKRTRA